VTPAHEPVPPPEPCPLCGAASPPIVARAHRRTFRACAECGLASVPPAERPDAASAAVHYATHRNAVDDPGYRGFLDRLAAPLTERLAPGARGLDYGCGPAPALAQMLRERGFRTAVWDPIFAPDPAPLGVRYEFVTCTETAEHFFDPARALERIDALLLPGGLLGLMTQTWSEETRWDRWRYARDPTHVCFYRLETFRWIAARFGWRLETPREHVALFRKP
jgi:SAM-dependent methyltransferase